jgi:signal transduction histidine kinase
MENETWISLIFWIGTLSMLVLVLLIIIITIIYQKKVLDIKRLESENLLSISLESEKKERKRIASDLHDGVSGDLNAVRNFVVLLAQQEKNEEKKALYTEIKDTLQQTVNNIKNISYNLMPSSLDNLGFIPTLKDYIDRIRKANQITIEENYESDFADISINHAYELYRIIQEILNNCIKYGKISSIHVQIKETNGLLYIEIKDNGIAFDFEEALKQTKGMGLKNIKSRIQHIKGQFKQSNVEGGNLYTLIIKI